MNTHEWRAAAAKIADRWVTPIQREYGLGGAGAEIRAMPLPDMGGAEAMREAAKGVCAERATSFKGLIEKIDGDSGPYSEFQLLSESVALCLDLASEIHSITLPAATHDKTAEALAEVVAERDALKRDVAMMPHTLALAYKIREALGWNQYHSLDIMPDEIKRRAQAQSRAAEALEKARRAIAGTLEETFGSIRLSYPLDRLLREALAAIDAAKGPSL